MLAAEAMPLPIIGSRSARPIHEDSCSVPHPRPVRKTLRARPKERATQFDSSAAETVQLSPNLGKQFRSGVCRGYARMTTVTVSITITKNSSGRADRNLARMPSSGRQRLSECGKRAARESVVFARQIRSTSSVRRKCVVKLTLRDRESAQEAVRRFRKLVERSGIKKEMRVREFYEKPSETKRRARLRAQRRARRERFFATH
jgi:small subunit ribosomal protein S21